MFISGLMDSKSENRYGSPGSFPGREVMNFMNWGRRRVVEILYVRLSMYDRPMETVKYMCVNIRCMLDWFAGLAEIHFLKI